MNKNLLNLMVIIQKLSIIYYAFFTLFCSIILFINDIIIFSYLSSSNINENTE